MSLCNFSRMKPLGLDRDFLARMTTLRRLGYLFRHGGLLDP